MKKFPALLIFIVSYFYTNSQTPNEILAAELDTYIQKQMSAQNIPGLSACTVKGDEVVWKAAYGIGNIDLNTPVTLETQFTLASISKLFTATACAQLWENGLLDLDADINDYLPINIINPNFPNTPITTRQLLTHQSSLRDFESDLQIWENIGDPTISLTDFCSNYFIQGGDYYVASNFGTTAPGQSTYWYSNAGFTLLGYIVQEVSGMPFNTYCKINIQEPLGMNKAAWFFSNTNTDNIAMPYNNNLIPQGYFSVPEYPAAMLKADINELSQFLIAYTQKGTYQDFELLEPNTFETVVPDNMMNGFGWWGIGSWYGDQNGNFWSHGGFMDGIRTQLNYYPSDSTGLIILTNGEGNYNPIQQQIESYIPLFNENEVTTTIETTSLSDILVYPNLIPDSNILNIDLNGVEVNDLQCFIYDASGQPLRQLLLNSNLTEINVSDLPSGFFFGEIIDEEKIRRYFKFYKG